MHLPASTQLQVSPLGSSLPQESADINGAIWSGVSSPIFVGLQLRDLLLQLLPREARLHVRLQCDRNSLCHQDSYELEQRAAPTKHCCSSRHHAACLFSLVL